MERLHDVDVARVLIGLIIAGVGFYYFLTNTLGLALPDGSARKLNATLPCPSVARWVTISFKSISLGLGAATFG